MNEIIKLNIKKNVSIKDAYYKICRDLNLHSSYEDIVDLYKDEINYRMNSFFNKETDNLNLSIDFNEFYNEMMKKDEFKYKNDLLKKLQKVYEKQVNFSCFSLFAFNSYEKKLYNLYNVLSIEELNKLNI